MGVVGREMVKEYAECPLLKGFSMYCIGYVRAAQEFAKKCHDDRISYDTKWERDEVKNVDTSGDIGRFQQQSATGRGTDQ